MSTKPDVSYQTWPASPPLAPYVEHFWAVEVTSFIKPHSEILIPNGRPTILVCLAEPGLRIAIEGGHVERNVSNAAGILTKPIMLEQQGASSYVAAQLRPWGLKAFGLPLLIDATQPLSAWIGGDLAVRDLEAACATKPFGPDRVLPLQAALESKLVPLAPDTLSLLQRSLKRAADGEGVWSVAELVAHLGISYHALYQLFRRHLGISIKQYLSVIRFYEFCGSLLQGKSDNLALLVSLQGYYDQPHATREFRRYTGMTQSDFRITLNGIAKLMHQLP